MNDCFFLTEMVEYQHLYEEKEKQDTMTKNQFYILPRISTPVLDSMELDARDAASNSKASNVNNININMLKVCRQLAKKKRNGKRSEDAER